MGEQLHIGLMGPFGYGNIADEALIDAVISNLNDLEPDWKFVGFSLEPTDTTRQHGIAAYPLSHVATVDGAGRIGQVLARWRASASPLLRRLERVVRRVPAEFGLLRDAFRATGEIDAMVMCGSGQIQDYWCGGGPFSYPYTTLRWVLLAKLRRIPFLVVSVGAGPVHSGLSARFFRYALSLTEYRSFRDRWSKDFVADVVGFDRDDPVVADLAFSLPPTPNATGDDDVDDVDDLDGGRLIGIGPVGYFREDSWPEADESQWTRYRDEIVAVVSTLISNGDRVVFLKGEGIHDQPVVDEIRAEVRANGIDVSRSLREVPVMSVAELVAALEPCDVVIAARYHNVLFSYIVDRPVVGISYQEKTDALMQRYDEDELCLAISTMTADEVLGLIDKATTRDRSRRGAVTADQRRLLDEQYGTMRSVIVGSSRAPTR